MSDVQTDKEAYLQSILNGIASARGRYVRTYARARQRLSGEVARHVEKYFKNNPDYEFQMRKCAKCKNEYDIVILIRKI